MVRVAVSVEGKTEAQFIRTVLRPYLEGKDIAVVPVSMNGGIKVERVQREVKRLLRSFGYVTTFYDFYGFGGKEGNDTKESLENRLKSAMEGDARQRFLPYIQIHEFEGLLFASPEAMGKVLREESVIEWANGILRGFRDDPEQINDSSETAPSKRLCSKYSLYQKTFHGPEIAREAGIDRLRERCAGFNAWLDKVTAFGGR